MPLPTDGRAAAAAKSHDHGDRSRQPAGRASSRPSTDGPALVEEQERTSGCAGIQLAHTEIHIRAEDGTTVPQGSRGEILARGFWQRSACQS
ncbi:hypothetical protein [Streptomyces sp900116325]|uniref:hypothetical protein n=1 Tax=Streptomyces sp. 900116325 TaxID=3154295 RepID=UPI0033AA0246